MRTEVKLKNGTVLRAGETYLIDGWSDEERIKINIVGDTKFLAYTINGWEEMYDIEEDWIPYEEPKKEKWVQFIKLVSSNLGVGEKNSASIYLMTKDRFHTLGFVASEVEILREWDSKEDMINDLKKG